MLQDLLEIALGNALAFGDVAAAHRMLADVAGHVEHGFDGEHGLLAEPRHPQCFPSGAFCRSRRHSCRSETTGAARRPVELAYFTPHCPGMPGHDQLCNSHAAGDAEWLLA